jgi:hypothetical protein
VLWVDGEIDDAAQLRQELVQSWHDLPGRLRQAYRSGQPDVVRDMRTVWDDPDWLGNVVPNLIDPSHRLSI